MSEARLAAPPSAQSRVFDFTFEKAADGWRWSAFDRLGRIAGEGVAPTKAMAAAFVIQALSRT
jgi:hypothetical protein